MAFDELLRNAIYSFARPALLGSAFALALGGCQEPATSSSAKEPARPAGEHVPQALPEQAHGPAEHDHSLHVLPASKPLADQSLYHLQVPLTDQDGRSLELASLRGSAVLAVMFYASCQSVCPMLVAQLARLDGMLPSDARARTQVLLVSLDPARDKTEKLKELAQRHGINDPRWHIVRTQADSVREIAAVLGVRYRQLPDGEISHSPIIVLLDGEGVVAQRMENASDDPAPLAAAATKLAQSL